MTRPGRTGGPAGCADAPAAADPAAIPRVEVPFDAAIAAFREEMARVEHSGVVGAFLDDASWDRAVFHVDVATNRLETLLCRAPGRFAPVGARA